MVDVATLALEARTDGLLKAEAALDQVTRAAVRTEAAADGVTAAAHRQSGALASAAGASRMAGGGFQNLGYQIQDFAVQVGAGTSATQALGQQLPQLLSGFGMIGIAVGTLSAVALPLLALAFADNADNATALASALDDLTASTEQFRIAAQAIRLGIDEEEVLIVEQINSLTRERIALEAKMSEAYGHQRRILDLQHKELVGQITTLQNTVSKYREARDTAEKLKNEITLGAQAARAAASGVADIGAQAQGAVGRVKNLASALWDAAKAAQARVTLMNEASRNYGKIQNTGDSGPDAAKRSVLGLNAPGVITGVLSSGAAGVYDPGPGAGGGAGGGGGGGDDGFQSRLDALMEGLQTERDTVDQWYAESMEILNDRRAEELLGAQGHADALLMIEEELQRRKAELRDQDLGHYQSFFGSMAGALQAGGSKMLAISKGFALAEAAVSMWRGAAKALELPFPASLAAWGQVIATGTKALAGIRGASFGGGGASGGGGIGATPVAPVATPSRSLRINVEGEGIFADQLRRSMRVISEALGEERDIGGFVVT